MSNTSIIFTSHSLTKRRRSLKDDTFRLADVFRVTAELQEEQFKEKRRQAGLENDDQEDRI
jgi:hypothetical protein